MTAEDIPRFAACTAEAYRGYPLFDHLFGPAYSPSAVETIFGASMRCSRGLLGVSDTAAGGQGSIHRRVPRARRPGTPRLRRSRHRETPVRLRILLQRGHGKAHRRGYMVSFQPLRKTGVPRERALVEGHEACPGAHRGQGTEMLPGDPEGIQRRPLRASRLRGGGEGHGTGFGHPPFRHGLGKRKTVTPERSRMQGLFGFVQKYASTTLQTRHNPNVPAIPNGYIRVRGP